METTPRPPEGDEWHVTVREPGDLSISDLVQMLKAGFVDKSSDLWSYISRSGNPDPAFVGKEILYRHAGIVFSLWSRCQKGEERFRPLWIGYERMVSSQREHEISAFDFQRAVQSFQRLVAVERGEFTWARDWLLEIGIDETNPATLAKLSYAWRSYLTTVSLVLVEWRPILDDITKDK